MPTAPPLPSSLSPHPHPTHLTHPPRVQVTSVNLSASNANGATFAIILPASGDCSTLEVGGAAGTGPEVRPCMHARGGAPWRGGPPFTTALPTQHGQPTAHVSQHGQPTHTLRIKPRHCPCPLPSPHSRLPPTTRPAHVAPPPAHVANPAAAAPLNPTP